jgi:hypothetical protein
MFANTCATARGATPRNLKLRVSPIMVKVLPAPVWHRGHSDVHDKMVHC